MYALPQFGMQNLNLIGNNINLQNNNSNNNNK